MFASHLWSGRSSRPHPDIQVTAVEPGSFPVSEPIREGRLSMNGNQLGEADRPGDAIIALADAPNPPGT